MKLRKLCLSISLILSAALVCLLAAPAEVEAIDTSSGTCGDNLTWVLNDTGTLTISGSGQMDHYNRSNAPWYSNSYSIKEVVICDGVTSIGEYAFSYCPNLTAVTISDSVTSIGQRSFYQCGSLSSVTLGSGITSISQRVFESCSALEAISIPDGVTSIDAHAFYYCTSLTTIHIPDTMTDIALSAFYYCSNLTYNVCDNAKYLGNAENPYVILMKAASTNITSCTIPNETKSINSEAFRNCTNLQNCSIPDGILRIGDWAFASCALTSIEIPDSVISIGENAFSDCTRTTSVTIGNSVVAVSDLSFSNCKSLKSITIPNSVTYIGELAFYRCSALTSVTFGNGVVTIGKDAFDGCGSVTEVYITDPISWCKIEFGNSEANPTSYGAYLRILNENGNEVTVVTLDQTVSAIPANAFQNSKLTAITIPNSVTAIGNSAFINSDSLTDLAIGDGVANIGYSAFKNCTNLKNVYYAGSQDQWNQITIGNNNSTLSSATIHYNHVHDYSVIPPVTVEASCTTAGYIKYTCIHGENYQVILPALGHQVGTDSEVVPPQCDKQGYTLSTCPRCGEQHQTDITPSLGHRFVKTPAVPPTCTETGLTTGYACEHCGWVVSGQNKVPPLGHRYADGKCTVCGVLNQTPGEIDGNEGVNTDDVIQLLLHISMPEAFPINAEADFTGDGKVTTDDVIQLLLHVSMPDTFPLYTKED